MEYLLVFIAGVLIGNALKQFIYIGFKEPEPPKVETVQVNPDAMLEYLDPEIRDFYNEYYRRIEV